MHNSFEKKKKPVGQWTILMERSRLFRRINSQKLNSRRNHKHKHRLQSDLIRRIQSRSPFLVYFISHCETGENELVEEHFCAESKLIFTLLCASGATVQALAVLLEITNEWDRNSEHFFYGRILAFMRWDSRKIYGSAISIRYKWLMLFYMWLGAARAAKTMNKINNFV